ncbi:hypothetical protein [Micromonospora cathayae]|uniref:Uncharacterized protein n=1 Tax=Micromonospora cathayae TaxID=3028804 RepID=A0ABY7ZKC9_9ACTN|nr:hypothetical protein [Micromonospora sp. HUAS 3]WDZ82553.1 hypothetical protein PVK37_18940 [Micromonospora sp. HUAS 3]
MTVRVDRRHDTVERHGTVVRVAGTPNLRPGCVARPGRVSPTRQWRAPGAPPRRDDHRRWETDGRGWAHG